MLIRSVVWHLLLLVCDYISPVSTRPSTTLMLASMQVNGNCAEVGALFTTVLI